MEFKHLPVMFNECMENLNLKPHGTYFDGTLGGGGHALGILERTAPDGFLFAIDRDLDAIEAASERLRNFRCRLKIRHANFKEFSKVADELEIFGIDGAILDLGVSSYQLDNRERGFAYMSKEVKLDMRMDRTSSVSAYEIVNEYSESKLKYIISTYGEEKFASNIVKNIIAKRSIKPITTTGELVDICDMSIPFKFKRDTHPAKKTFQALRIAVNEELDGLDEAIKDIVKRLNKGGRLAIITFHSLEDRIVKNVFKDLQTACTCDKRYPCVCNRKQIVKEVNKKPITASEKECLENSRSKCAKLRVVEKL